MTPSAIELEENTIRLDLTDFEASAAKLRQIEAAEREAEEEVSRQDAAKLPGRPKSGNREAARRTGLDEKEIRRTKKHVAAAEEHPAFQGAGTVYGGKGIREPLDRAREAVVAAEIQ